MYRLSSIILVLFGCAQMFAQSSPHGKDLIIDCAKCHTSESWDIDYKTIEFDHSITDFALEGTHLQTNCTECHTSLVFDEAKTDCISCHTDLHSSTVGNDCARCHSPESWIVNNIPELHEQNGFPLTGPHNTLACAECHTSETNLRFDRIGNDCITCHNDDFNNTKEPDHIAGNFSKDCSLCHSSFGTEWTPSTFEHGFFPLTDGHDIKDCTQCHTNNNFDDTSSDCVSCHQTDFDNSLNPNHTAANFDTDCKQCHTPSPDWVPVTWDHDFFPLTLGHDIQDCNVCHTTANYADQVADCVSCHQTDFDNTNNTTSPNHIDAGFDTDCIQCHTPGSWTPSTFDHSFFPLTLGHDVQDCATCHTTTVYADQSADCVSCHQTDFNSTTDPNHINAGFPTDCITCHTTNPNWTPSTFDHSFFPLTDGHDLPDCTQCHTTANFSDQVADCVSCHQTTFDNTTNPNHAGAGFDTDCISCHTTSPGWTPSTFDHTFFPLTLGHDVQDCVTCHTTPVYADQSADCVSCHQTDFNNTTDPNHVAAGFPTDCISCHTTDPNWTPSTFDHSFFPLTDGHDLPDCTQCHTTANFSDQVADCVSCHQTTFDNTTNPNHISAGFDTDCIQCHTPSGWTPSTFDHTFFPLTLGHDVQDCATCHTTPVYADQSADCVSCHQTDFNNTTDPNHVDAGFPTDCISCHTTDPNWTPTTFDHSLFPLTLGHDIQDCTQCHASGVYAGTSTDCVSCHQTNYDNTTNPNHVTAGFNTDCIACHTPDGWTPSSFDHNLFPLTLGHNIQDCATCHTTGNYSDQSADCVSCHQTDFNNTTNPNHVSAAFPTDCVACHTTNPGWTPADFDHDGMYFPIYSGKHQGEWSSCAECHTTANNYTAFSCIDCHEHNNQADLANEHNGVSGYTYTPTSCFDCHPNGTEDGGGGGD